MRDNSKQQRYINPLQLHIPYFEIIAVDNNFIVERSEASNIRSYTTTSTTEIHTTPHNTNIQIQDSNELLSDASESQEQSPQKSPQRTQPITQPSSNAQLENLSLHFEENQSNDNNQDELQHPNSTLETQSTDLTVESNTLMVSIRPIEDQDISHNTQQDPQNLIQGSLELIHYYYHYTTNTFIEKL